MEYTAYLTIIASDNALLPSRRQAIIWTNAGIFLIRPLWTNLSEILIEIHIFSFKKMHLKLSSAKRRPFCLGLNVLKQSGDGDGGRCQLISQGHQCVCNHSAAVSTRTHYSNELLLTILVRWK